MTKAKFYFCLGIILILIGAYLIHPGLSTMLLGALALLVSYIEYEEESEYKKEE